MNSTPRNNRAFTLIELMVSLTVVAAIAVIILPTLSDDTRLRVMAASAVLASDIEYAQVLNISHPDNPVIVRFDDKQPQYWLAYRDEPNKPIIREDTGQPYFVMLGNGRGSAAEGVSFVLDGMTTNDLEFDANGGLVDLTSSPEITLSHGDKAITLAVSPTTGSVNEFVPKQQDKSAALEDENEFKTCEQDFR